jgi:hypothetical protein
MSKQELLCWTSLGVTISVVVMYLLIVFGWPDILPDYSSRIVKIFVNLFWIALIFEIIIGIKENSAKIDKDERDIMVEAFSYKYSYNFVMIILVFVLSNILFDIIFGESVRLYSILSSGSNLFHILFLTLLMASLIRRSTMIYLYRKAF